MRLYYGWVNVAVAAVAMTATLPGRTYGLALVKEPLRADLGVTDGRFSDLNFLAIVLGASCVLPVGWLIDRLGARRVLGLVAALLGGCVVWMAQVADETQLFVALTLVRGLGQGALSVVAIALVGKWFRRRAGLAMGVFAVLLTLGFSVVPVLGGLVADHGWRPVWSGVGFAVLAFAPVGLLLARSSPEAVGVAPDEPAEAAPPPAALGVAARTPAFWAYTLAAMTFNLTFSAVTLDNEQLLRDRGLDGARVNADVLAVMMAAGLPANLLAGWLARRWPMGRLLAAGVVALAASLAYFPFVATAGDAAVYGALLGASGGVVTVVYFAAYGHDYGRAHLGGIQSAVQVLTVLASAVGPVLLSACRAWSGATDAFFYGFAAVAVALAVAAWAVRPPGPR